MTDLERVGNSDNFEFRGIPSSLQVCEKRSQAMQKKKKKKKKKKKNECLHSDVSMFLLHIYSKS